MLGLGAKLDEYDDSGRYPIHHAAASKNLELFTFLIESGAKIDQQTTTSADRRDYQTSGLLSSSGYNPNEGSQPIHIAAACRAHSICVYLIKKGISKDVKDNNGKTPLQYACGEIWDASNAEVIKLFDPEGVMEKRFRNAIGPNSQSIRTGGLYVRIVENFGRNSISGDKKWVAQCLETKENFEVKLMFLNVDTDSHEEAIRIFRSDSINDRIMTGRFSLSGDNLHELMIRFYGVPDLKFEILKGQALGAKLVAHFMSNQESYFPGSYDKPEPESDFVFYAQ